MNLDQPKIHSYITIFYAIALVCMLLAPSFAFADTPDVATAEEFDPKDPLGSRLCLILTILLGRTSQAIAIIGIFAAGIGALSGKLQWTTCLVVVTGLIMMFLSPQIVSMIMGSGMSSSPCIGTSSE